MARPLTDAVAELVATGLDQRQTILLLEIVAMSTGNSTGQFTDPVAEKRRAYDRQRKAVHRKSGGNPVESTPDPKSAISITSNSEIQNKEEKKERKRGKVCPPDFAPSAKHIEAGLALGFTEIQINEQAEDMRLWAQSNEHRAIARKSDWDKTFLSWLRRNKPNGRGNGNGKGHAVMEATDDLIDRAGGREIEGNPSMRDVTPTGSDFD